MARVVNAQDLGRVLVQDERDRRDRVLAAVREAAEDGARVVQRAAPKDQGGLGGSAHVEPAPWGARLVVDAPHARAVEFGARPHTPPLAPLVAWVLRHSKLFGAAAGRDARGRFTAAKLGAALAEQIARGIQRKIAREGSKPTHFVAGTLPRLREILAKKLSAALKGSRARRG